MLYLIPFEDFFTVLIHSFAPCIKEVLVPLRDRDLIRLESQILPYRLHDLQLLS